MKFMFLGVGVFFEVLSIFNFMGFMGDIVFIGVFVGVDILYR